jgi:hypothetical protein
MRAALVAAFFVAGTAHAGRACEEKTVAPEKTAIAFDTAAHLARTLEASGQEVAILARRGQNLEKYGVSFSHAGFAVKENGAWQIYHELNLCGSALSKLYVQGLVEFLADDLLSQEVAVVVPEPWLQSRLKQVLASKEEQFRMHHPAYSAVAYPFSTKYQNSNGWVLETYARAAADLKLENREQAQGWLKAAGYAPNIIQLGALTRLGGRMFKANVAFDDHPGELRWNDKITVSTGDAVLRFVSKLAVRQPDCQHGGFPEQVCLVEPE